MIAFEKTGELDLSEVKTDTRVNCVVEKGNYAYIGASSDGGGGAFIVVNITDRANPVISDSLVGIGYPVYSVVISEDGNTAFAYGGAGNLTRIDITDKGSVSITDDITVGGTVTSLQLYARPTSLQYMSSNALLVLWKDNDDIFYLSPVLIGETLELQDPIVTVESIGSAALDSFFVDRDAQTLYVGQRDTDGISHVAVVDISGYPDVTYLDPITPVAHASIIPLVVAIDDTLSFIYIDSDAGEARVLYNYDVTTPANPVLLGSLITTITNADQLTQMAAIGIVLLVADIPDSIRAFNDSDPTTPVQDAVDTDYRLRSVSSDGATHFCGGGQQDEGPNSLFVFSMSGTSGPTITDISPNRGGPPGGTTVTLTGTGFVVGATTVIIGGNTIEPADVTVNEDGTSLTFVTPAHAVGDVEVTVTTDDGTSNAVDFEYALGSGYLEKSEL